MTPSKACTKETEIALLKQNFSYMKEHLEKIEAKVDSIIPAFTNALISHGKESDAKYATKDEHKMNLERITKIESALGKVMWLLVAAIVASILKLVLA
jgi:hypothetical protein